MSSVEIIRPFGPVDSFHDFANTKTREAFKAITGKDYNDLMASDSQKVILKVIDLICAGSFDQNAMRELEKQVDQFEDRIAIINKLLTWLRQNRPVGPSVDYHSFAEALDRILKNKQPVVKHRTFKWNDPRVVSSVFTVGVLGIFTVSRYILSFQPQSQSIPQPQPQPELPKRSLPLAEWGLPLMVLIGMVGLACLKRKSKKIPVKLPIRNKTDPSDIASNALAVTGRGAVTGAVSDPRVAMRDRLSTTMNRFPSFGFRSDFSNQGFRPTFKACGNDFQDTYIQGQSSRSFFDKFIQENSQEPFRKALQTYLTPENKVCFSTFNDTYDRILAPSRTALEWIASEYAKKYGVTIQIANVGDCEDKTDNELNDTIDKLEKQNPQETYTGIIFCDIDKRGDREQNSPQHVAPILCHFGPPNPGNERSIRFLTLDVLGKSCLAEEAEAIIRAKRPDATIIHYEGSIRQADAASCRTAALSTLRNAILSIRHQYSTFPDGGKKLEKIPAQWNAHEQIYSSPPEELDQPHIRDLHLRRSKIRTIRELRQSHKETARMRYRFHLKPEIVPSDISLPEEVYTISKK